jgi:hypothetical protein
LSGCRAGGSPEHENPEKNQEAQLSRLHVPIEAACGTLRQPQRL